MNFFRILTNSYLFLALSIILNTLMILTGRAIEGEILTLELNQSLYTELFIYIFLDFIALEITLYHIENYKKPVPYLHKTTLYIKRNTKEILARNFIYIVVLLFIVSVKFLADTHIYNKSIFNNVLSNLSILLSLFLLVCFFSLKTINKIKKDNHKYIRSFKLTNFNFTLFIVIAISLYLYSYLFDTNIWYTVVTTIFVSIIASMILISWAYQFLINPLGVANIIKFIPSLVFVVIIYIFFSLPNVRQIEKVTSHTSIPITIKNNKITAYPPINSIPIKYQHLPKHLISALITQEDRSFYSHLGFSIKGTSKGLIYKILRKRGGGSTITQQLAKNLFFSGERSIRRKFEEILLALKIEMNFTKKEILTMYFNNIFYGNRIYGIENAARVYFNKRTNKLNLYEATILVQTIPSPNSNNVKKHKKRAFKRANRLLDDMKGENYITSRAIVRAKKTGIKKGYRVLRSREHRFLLDYIESNILEFCEGKEGKFTVVLTLEPEVQLYAEYASEKILKTFKGKAPQTALLALAPDGAIKAMVGGNKYTDKTMNRTLHARRQPASAFKPIVYLAAFENGYRPNSKISDKKININGYRPKNYDGKYLESITLKYALKNSRNTSSVRLLQKIGYEKVDSIAKRLGITETLPHKPHLALGSKEISMLELTTAYTVFSNGGKSVKPYGIELIRDKMGNIIYEHQQARPKQVIKTKHITELNNILKDVIKTGTGKKANFKPKFEIAGKTGTGQGYKDAWFVGYSPYLTTSVWMGYDKKKTMRGVSGGSYPAKIWRHFMINTHDSLPSKNLP